MRAMRTETRSCSVFVQLEFVVRRIALFTSCQDD